MTFLDDVLSGLGSSPKTLPSKYLYDELGSRLFEQITRVPEYYPTRMESALLREIAPLLSERIPKGGALIEFGSGSSAKTRALLKAAPQLAIYAPLDISVKALEEAADRTRVEFPSLLVAPIVGDFTQPFCLPQSAASSPCIGFFPGSTIGNFTPSEAKGFLEEARISLGSNARFLIGYDLVKDAATLEAAYDDAAGVTANFNMNILTRMNRELGADFQQTGYRHRALWNAEESRIEMHLVSQHRQQAIVAGRQFSFTEGETIRTETSYKYSEAAFCDLATQAGWRLEEIWTSPPPCFGIVLLVSD